MPQTMIVRQQLQLFLHNLQTAGMNPEQGRRFLRLGPEEWQQWAGVLEAAPIPDRSAVSVILRHLGYANNLLSRAN